MTSDPASANSRIGLSEIAQALARLEGWLQTWYLPPGDGSGGIGGPVATLWGSSWYAVGPHVMNVCPVLRGLCRRSAADGNEDCKRRAAALVTFLLRVQDPTTGLFACGYGDIPYKPTGLIIQVSAINALWDFYRIEPDKAVEKAADRAWSGCGNRLIWNVANHVLRAAETRINRARAKGAGLVREDRAFLARWGKWVLAQQFLANNDVRGAFPQAAATEAIYFCYQGKCLAPLLLMGEALADGAYLAAARALGNFLRNSHGRMSSKESSLLKYAVLPNGQSYDFYRFCYKFRRLLPFAERPLRLLRRRAIGAWTVEEHPIWIARSADTVRGFLALAETTGERQWRETAESMISEILRYQSPLGGIRNTMGFFGEPAVEPNSCWQDAAPIPRWNAYVAQLLSEMIDAAECGANTPIEPEGEDRVALADGHTYVETATNVELLRADGRPVWAVVKGRHWGRPRIAPAQWDEGDVQRGHQAQTSA